MAGQHQEEVRIHRIILAGTGEQVGDESVRIVAKRELAKIGDIRIEGWEIDGQYGELYRQAGNGGYVPVTAILVRYRIRE